MFWRQSKILACLTSLQKNQKRMAVTKEPGIFSYSLSLPGGSVVLGSRWIGSSSSSSLRIKRPLKPQTRDSKPQTPKQNWKKETKEKRGTPKREGNRPTTPHHPSAYHRHVLFASAGHGPLSKHQSSNNKNKKPLSYGRAKQSSRARNDPPLLDSCHTPWESTGAPLRFRCLSFFSILAFAHRSWVFL